MSYIFINLKRFDIPRNLGGICSEANPELWIRGVIAGFLGAGLGREQNTKTVFLLPESLVLPACDAAEDFPDSDRHSFAIGCQGVYREDVTFGGNFGAFTTKLPATAAKNLGAEWTIIGHSEERRDILGVLSIYDPTINETGASRIQALATVNSIVNQEAQRAMDAGMSVLFCVGETEEERGYGSFDEQKPCIETALRSQITAGLMQLKSSSRDRDLVIGYEPIWAIGPGKIPPGAEYIDFVGRVIQSAAEDTYGAIPPIVYGGGLKKENADMIGSIPTLSGGLVALTKFTPPIGFSIDDLKVIIDNYRAAGERE